jgi:TorA maturation chaperone TorD
MLRPRDESLARSRLYSLLAMLFLKGLTSETLPLVRQMPVLSDELPPEIDLEHAAADHFDLFQMEVPPFASVFLEPEVRLGGDVASAVARMYEVAGFQGEGSEGADHVATELTHLSTLCAADAWDSQGRFLLDHVTWWLPALIFSVRRGGYPFYQTLADVTLELVHDHAASFAGESHFRLPEPPEVLERTSTSLKTIAEYLTTPVFSGLYLSRSEIAALARHSRIPRGFGSRSQTLANLLRSASEYDSLPDVLAALDKLVSEWEAFYLDDMKTASLEWRKRLGRTKEMLKKMEAATHQSSHSTSTTDSSATPSSSSAM